VHERQFAHVDVGHLGEARAHDLVDTLALAFELDRAEDGRAPVGVLADAVEEHAAVGAHRGDVPGEVGVPSWVGHGRLGVEDLGLG
jgi:hypothetical protein